MVYRHKPQIVSPWVPMTDPVDLKHCGKLAEELSECGSAVARCIIQGIDECQPVTKKMNRQWLQEEIADVLANIELVCERFALETQFILSRKKMKKKNLAEWHKMPTAQ